MKYETYIDEELHLDALREEMDAWPKDRQSLFNVLMTLICKEIKEKLQNDEMLAQFYDWCFGPSNADFYVDELPVLWNKRHGEEYWITNMKFFLIDFRVMYVMFLKMLKEKKDGN